jgi:hypothetical protein
MAAGLVATVVMTGFMAMLPLIGFPRVDVPALIVEPLTGRSEPAGSAWWWLGMLIHLFLGAVVFPLAFRIGQRWLPTMAPVLIGWLLGVTLFAIGEGVLIPFSGGGFFSSNAARPGLTVLEDFLSHSVYGLLLGLLAGRSEGAH